MVLLLAAALFVTSGCRPSLAAELTAWNGDQPSRFALESLTDDRVNVDDYGGRVVLVHFFATWCEPCRPELAALQRLAGRYARRPLTVLAIDVGEVGDRVQRFFATQPVTFPVLIDDAKAVTKAWQVSTLPTTFILDRTLAARFIVEGDFDWDRADADDALDRLLKATPTG